MIPLSVKIIFKAFKLFGLLVVVLSFSLATLGLSSIIGILLF